MNQTPPATDGPEDGWLERRTEIIEAQVKQYNEAWTGKKPATEGQVALLATSLHRLLALTPGCGFLAPVFVEPTNGAQVAIQIDVDPRWDYAIEQAREALRLCGWTPPGDEAPPHDNPLCFDMECLG